MSSAYSYYKIVHSLTGRDIMNFRPNSITNLYTWFELNSNFQINEQRVLLIHSECCFISTRAVYEPPYTHSRDI